MANTFSRRLAARFRRVVLYRLVMPVLRAKHPPEYTARGVLFGLIVAMTPTVGIQMPIVMLVWMGVKLIRPSWNFNVVVALVWTWVTNVFTLPPIYYVFLVTGRIMMGGTDGLADYMAFTDDLQAALSSNDSIVHSLWIYTIRLFEIWGVPMFVGCVPWAIVSAWLGYRWSLRLIQRFRDRRQRRLAERRRLRQKG